MYLQEGSRYAAAILAALLLVAISRWIGNAMYPDSILERSVYRVPGVADPVIDLAALRRSWPQALESPEDRARLLGYVHDLGQANVGTPAGEASASAAPAAEQIPDFASAIPAANMADGQQIAQRCQQCHVWDKGGPNKIGPDLYGIIGRPRASHPGFDYSSAMTAKGGTWTYDEIFRFLRAPGRYIPGTKMTFIGLPRAQDRLNLMAFMRTWADTPAPLPPHSTQQATADSSTKTTKSAPAKASP